MYNGALFGVLVQIPHQTNFIFANLESPYLSMLGGRQVQVYLTVLWSCFENKMYMR